MTVTAIDTTFKLEGLRKTMHALSEFRDQTVKTACRHRAADKSGIAGVPLLDVTWKQWFAFNLEYDRELAAARMPPHVTAEEMAKLGGMSIAQPDAKPMTPAMLEDVAD